MSSRYWKALVLTATFIALAMIFWPREERKQQTQPVVTKESVTRSLAEPLQAESAPDVAARPEPPPAPLPSTAPPAPDETKTGDEEALSPTRTAVRLYGNAKVRPLYNLQDDAIAGVQISNIAPGSFWEELGVEDGDIILELNGEVIDTPAASVNLMNQFSRGFVLNLRLRTAEGVERFIDYRTPSVP